MRTFRYAVVITVLGQGAWFARAQTNVFPAAGNVGIGTTNPEAKVEVVDGAGDYQIGDGGYWAGFKTTAAPGVWGFQQGEIAFFGIGGNIYNRGFSQNAMGIMNGSTTAQDIFLYNRNDPTADVLVLKASGNVGIGTTTPASKLHIDNPNGVSAETLLTIDNSHSSQLSSTVIGYTNSKFSIQSQNTLGTTFRDMLLNPSGGNVGIGTMNPTYPLSVNGSVQAKEVIVQSGWSDYVFDKSYKLAPLSEVHRTIEIEHHLPGMPTAKDVAAKGVSLGEMQAKLLAQVEELTLRLIEQDKHQREQEEEIADLRARNYELAAKVSKLGQEIRR